MELIFDRSGHYKPDKLDMYRGVKALEKRGVLHEDCKVIIDDVVISHNQFLQEMEQHRDGIPLWQKLTNERVEQHEAKLQGTNRRMNMRAALETAPKPSPSITTDKEEPFLKKGVQGRRRAPTNLKFSSGGHGM